MTAESEPRWTIDELGAQVALALAVDYDGQSNGRVRDVPDRRTIRFYTTLGLIDRPAEMRGRTALYGRRHLLQLVAIKRLQTRGLSLAEIQQELVGLPEKELVRIARLPSLPETANESVRADANGTADEGGDFWRAQPPTPSPSPTEGGGEQGTPHPQPLSPEYRGEGRKGTPHPQPLSPAGRGEQEGPLSPAGRGEQEGPLSPAGRGEQEGPLSPAGRGEQELLPPLPSVGEGGRGGEGKAPVSLQGIALDSEATLLLAAARPITEEDVQAIRTVAAPLLKLLEKRRLLRPSAERTTR